MRHCGTRGSWLKYGCVTVLGLGVIAAVVLGVALGIAVRQNRSTTFEQQTLAPEIENPGTSGSVPVPVRLQLYIHTAGASVKPIAAAPLAVSGPYAEYAAVERWALEDWTPEVRKREQEVLRQVQKLDAEAISEIEKALAAEAN